ncbi:calcium/sodium antiporter [Entomospira nematocerorum]|uniref:Calcium/sodium antiporter n=1 Tax=Entomospira nematocerorum TaxID=2719987 RepID=A0A968GG77_9SPIO|nr:calcium/sodium antiporter [Entomospira nematocera]NIZ46566.1 calcium/sodium antiporter [Entomospira nematocera]WDI33636.1 calcium/sodium antiporter [Entomospira nematocera]
MLSYILIIMVSLLFLFVGAHKFIDGAVVIARRLGMSSLMVGVIIIGFGTSTPEIIVSSLAALDNAPGIALGNAYGSNIVNIAFIIGITAIISPIIVQRKVILIEMPILLITALISLLLIYNGSLSRAGASLLLLLFVVYMSYTFIQSSRTSTNNTIATLDKTTKTINHNSLVKPTLILIIGLIAMLAGAKGFVYAASSLATIWGVSDLIIGLTIVSIGTSLPELFSSIVAATKRQHDMALGNIIGSNIFNTLVVVGLAGVINPINSIDPMIIRRDIPVMLGFSLLLFIFALSFKKEYRISRIEGLIFLLLYVAYIALLIRTL